MNREQRTRISLEFIKLHPTREQYEEFKKLAEELDLDLPDNTSWEDIEQMFS